jgi:hypothetical protein
LWPRLAASGSADALIPPPAPCRKIKSVVCGLQTRRDQHTWMQKVTTSEVTKNLAMKRARKIMHRLATVSGPKYVASRPRSMYSRARNAQGCAIKISCILVCAGCGTSRLIEQRGSSRNKARRCPANYGMVCGGCIRAGPWSEPSGRQLPNELAYRHRGQADA